MPDTTALTTYQASENAALSRTLLGLEGSMEQAARQNLEAVLATQGTNLQAFTDLEIEAMVATEKLRLVNGMDLAAILLRGKIIKDIEDRALFSVHPNGFANLTELALAQGLSVSDLSDIRSMTQVIFPWVEENLGVSIASIWESVGKTKFRVMCPVLVALITGEAPDADSARRNYERILDSAAVELGVNGEDGHDEEIRAHAARALIETAGHETTRGLQEHIRDGNVTPALEPTIVVVDGRRYMLAEVDDEQMVVLQRKLGRHMSQPDIHELPRDRRTRQVEAARIPLVRAINELMEG